MLKFCVKILFCQALFQSDQDIIEKREGSGACLLKFSSLTYNLVVLQSTVLEDFGLVLSSVVASSSGPLQPSGDIYIILALFFYQPYENGAIGLFTWKTEPSSTEYVSV